VSNFNKAILLGTLGRDPELTYTQGGVALCKFSIAINEKWTTKTGEKKEEVSWIDITAWNKTAELCGEYLKKGRQALIEGKLKQDRWEDADGKKRSKVTVTAERVQFIGGKGGSDQAATPADEEVSL
jgi:single-strand DNA-binding protein